MDSLPGDVVADILTLLPPRGLAVSRCVCKAWRATVDAGGLLRADLLPLTVGGVFTHLPHELLPPQFPRRPCKGRRKILAGDLAYVGIDGYCGIALPRVTDCCNGLLLLNNCVVNPATRRWARLPPCPPLPPGSGCKDGSSYLLLGDGYLLFDPAVSPHYTVLGLPYLLSGDRLKKKFAEGKLAEWPPSPWTVQVFSSGTQRWEDRSIVREGEAIAIPDLQQPSLFHCYAAYWHGSLYMHFEEGFLVRLTLTDDKYRVIKTPAAIDARPNGEGWRELRIGKSKRGVYCATFCGYQLRIWLLHESGSEAAECTLAHEKNLVAITTHVWQNVDHRTNGPWILQSYYRNEEKEDGIIEEGVLEWDFDTDNNVPDTGDIQDVDQRNCDIAIRIIGFDPYEEVIFLHLSDYHAIAYHWSTSKVQYMGHKLWSSCYDDWADSYFVYSPCWTGDLSEEN